MICNIMTPFLTLSISLLNFWKPDCFSWNQTKKAKPITMLVPTLCDCFSFSTFRDDSGNLQSRSEVLGHFCRKFLDVFQSQPPSPTTHLHFTKNVAGIYPEVFSEFQLCIGWEEGELQENFKKETLFNEGTQKLQEVLNIASQGLFVHDCSFY